MYFLGIDLGSSAVKVSVLDGNSGKLIASALSPAPEMEIIAEKPGWAEQHPETWWNNLKSACAELSVKTNLNEIGAVGISYQMHGLVLVDADHNILRPAIIWCDSRAAIIGQEAFKAIGEKKCLEHFLNAPGNFTASRLRWVKENEPEIYKRIHKIMLPGDYLAMKLTGSIQTTVSGLSEMILWDYKKQDIAGILLEQYEIAKDLIPDIIPTFSIQGSVIQSAAESLGLKTGTPVSYRSGDQPNNAFSLNILNPGEIAATAGTSGVIYAVTDQAKHDVKSRVNTFVHVNHSKETPSYGILLCINGTGILNKWLRQVLNTAKTASFSYEEINALAAQAPPGSENLQFFPFGNGAERLLENKFTGASIRNLDFNTHTVSHLLRSAQEGICYSLNYGFDLMKKTGTEPRVIRAGKANMFLSSIFRETLATITGIPVELYNTDGSQGAARGAGMGCSFYNGFREAFQNLQKLQTTEPNAKNRSQYRDSYESWLSQLSELLNQTS